MLAIIGGSGLTQLAGLQDLKPQQVETPYGSPSGPIVQGSFAGQRVLFLARHGQGHSIAPHEINYRANLWALHASGVREIVAVATVGGISSRMQAGVLLVPDQLIDYTWGRDSTYAQGPGQAVRHIDFTWPYSAALRQRLLTAAQTLNEPVVDGGTYAATQGPRLETAAEIRRLARDGADVVGMTGMPEAALARELDVAYATLGVVANAAAGQGESAQHISMKDIEAVVAQAMQRVGRVLERVVQA